MRQAHFLTPLFLSAPALIGVLIYEFVEQKNLTQPVKDQLLYTELGLSFLASLIVFMVIWSVFIWGAISASRWMSPTEARHVPVRLLSMLAIFILSPFGLTILKVSLKDTLDKIYIDALSVLIILSTIPFTQVSVGMAIGL